jgi:hypothetical protein
MNGGRWIAEAIEQNYALEDIFALGTVELDLLVKYL